MNAINNNLGRKISLPASIDRAKRFAKEVKRFAPGAKLAECQEATARMYDFSDWYSLAKACASAGNHSVAMDEDLPRDYKLSRARKHSAAIGASIFGLDATRSYAPAVCTSGADASTAANYAAENSHRAHMRFQRALCDVLVFEIGPSRRWELPLAEVCDETFGVARQALMDELPKHVVAWWRRSFPDLPDVADDIAGLYWNKDRPSAVLQMLACIGQMAAHYEHRVDRSMIVGITSMLIRQYVACMVMNQDRLERFDQHDVDWAHPHYIAKAQGAMKAYRDQAINCMAWERIKLYSDAAPEFDFFLDQASDVLMSRNSTHGALPR